MVSNIKRIIMYTSLFFVAIFSSSTVNASNYGSISARITQNNKMISEANSMSELKRNSYTDLSLKEIGETNHTALTTYQQNKLKQLANNILENNTNLTELEKMEKFYDWILDNYYVYKNPEKISGLSQYRRYDNPFYLLNNEYEKYGKVRARYNGFTSTLVALARTQGIPSRIVGGYYNQSVRDNYQEWGSNLTKVVSNHVWVEAYVDGSWKMFDPYADSYKEYNDKTNEYLDKTPYEEESTALTPTNNSSINNTMVGEETEINTVNDDNAEQIDQNNEEIVENENEDIIDDQEEAPILKEENAVQDANAGEANTIKVYAKKYFNPTIDNLSKTHIAFQTYVGSNNVKYIYDSSERNKLLAFLNYKSNNTANGKRINASYNTSDSSTWFVKNDVKSITNGSGKISKIFWPDNKSLTGNLTLEGFKSLEVLSVQKNKIKSLRITGASSLKQVNVSNNQMTKIVIIGSNKINYVNTANNPTTYVEYNFYGNNKKAFIKATKGGTATAYYKYSNGKHTHTAVAKANSDYNFVGWYNGKKRVSKSTKYTFNRGTSFTYVAKFEKKPPAPNIKISISKQKLWFYKRGKVVYTSNIVTGKRYSHDTPTGNFKIRGKARNVYLIGPDYKSYVNYWMPIYGDIGLHDATWRWSFGGSIYKYNGSHGCINLPIKTAKYIYNNAPVGTVVKVVK